MKKKLFMLSGLFAVTITALAFFYSTEKHNYDSSYMLHNIEALAQGEGQSPWQFPNGKPKDSKCQSTDNGKRCKASIRLCEGGGSGCNELKCSAHH